MEKCKKLLATCLEDQHIAYSRFDEGTWSLPLDVSSDGRTGRVALASDLPRRRAMAMWIHEVYIPLFDYTTWRVEYAVYDGASDTWSDPRPVAAPPAGSLDVEVALAFDSSGKAMATWVRQGGADDGPYAIDSPFIQNNLRRLVVATWDPATDTWSIETPMGLPSGALMPTIAFDSQDRPVLAYGHYGTEPGNTPTGLGTNNLLGYAWRQESGSWQAGTVAVRGVEWPTLVPLSENEMLVAYRGFGPNGTPSYNGALMGIKLRRDVVTGNMEASNPGQLVEGPGWMYSMAAAYSQDHVSTFEFETPNTVWGVGVYNLADMAPTATAAGVRLATMAEEDDVWGLNVPVMADLAIAVEDLHVGEPLPLPGAAVPISVTVRNLGLGRTREAVEVTLLLDPGQAEAQTLAAATIPAGLDFMESQAIQATWTAEAGVHILVAHVSPPLEDDGNGLNNYVKVMIGGPPAPSGLVAVPDPDQAVIQLGWQPVEGPAVTGYGIFRAEGQDELAQIGEADDPYFADADVQRGVTYRYAVCTNALEGVRSMPGEEVSATLPELPRIPIYLPLVSAS